MGLANPYILLGLLLYFIVRVTYISLVNDYNHNKARKGVYEDMASYRPELLKAGGELEHLINVARDHGDAPVLNFGEVQQDVINSYRRHGGVHRSAAPHWLALGILALLLLLSVL